MPRHVAHVPLRWADMDAYGHVNNVVYLRYLQEARVDMLFVDAARKGADHLAAGVVVARHEIDYTAPLLFSPGTVRVDTWVRDVRNSTFTLGYEVRDAADSGTTYAVASTTLVPYHLDAGRPRRVEVEEKAVLEGYYDDGPSPRAGLRSTRWTESEAARASGAKTYTYESAVRFDDLDSYGHVNNVTFAEYLQEARIDFALRHLADDTPAYEGSVVAGQCIQYLAPVGSRTESLMVEVWVTRLGGSSFDLAYEVRDDQRVYARATTALVAYDVQAGTPRTLTTAERAALEPFAPEGVA